MELFAHATKGLTDKMKDHVEKFNSSLLEEISKHGFFWTVLHFSSHYGHMDLLKYCISFFRNDEMRFDIYNLQTIEGKTPLFCAITSGDINLEKKKQIISLWFETRLVDLTLRKKTGEDLLELSKKNNLYNFIVENCLMED